MRTAAASRLRSEAGYSLVELLVSTAIMLTITGAIFSLVTPSQGTAQAQPEVSDLQQRARVGSEVLFKELVMAGAGPYQGPVRGSLINFFAPILPRRTGRITPDGPTIFRNDAITLTYVPNTYSQSSLSQPMPDVSAELKVNTFSNCPQGEELCGFKEGMELLIFDSSGFFDTFTVTEVQDDAGHLQHRGQALNHEYATGSSVTLIESNTYYLDRATNQLRQYDGADTDLPLVDNVIDLRFDYFGETTPPTVPKPQLGTANCLYDAAGTLKPGLQVLPANEGSLAALTPGMLTDGPWCGGGSNQFDADLLRIRKIRVTLRMQTGVTSLRGRDTRLFTNPGTATGAHMVPDYTVSFEVTPRNLNLTR